MCVREGIELISKSLLVKPLCFKIKRTKGLNICTTQQISPFYIQKDTCQIEIWPNAENTLSFLKIYRCLDPKSIYNSGP